MIYTILMLNSILATKLFVPQQRHDAVSRSILLQRLAHAVNGKLTLISAPAGFGKTTLASQWIKQSGYSHTWLSLDKSDSDPTRFLTYLISSLEEILPEVGGGLIARLSSPQPPPHEIILTTLINNILRATDQTFIFVIDDYHVLDSSAIDNLLEFFIEHQPPQMHLVITTREDPSFSLARLRARGELIEIRIADLRFTTEEIINFFDSIPNLNLSTDDISTLEARTEGWIASLQMAAISMQRHDDLAGFLESFSGSHRFILDYLMEEVLEHQTSDVVEFLLQTSFLDRLSGSLCDAVTDKTNSQNMLEMLEHNNMLIVPLDDERHWYRYHHLFADVLTAHANKTLSEQMRRYQLRASKWYEEQGLKHEAIQYAHNAKDHHRVADLLELSWPAIFNGFKPATWLGWVQTLPDEMVKTRPVLSAGYAWVLIDERHLDDVENRLRDAKRGLDSSIGKKHDDVLPIIVNETEFASLPSTIAGGYAYLSHMRGDAPATIRHAHQALDLLPKYDHYNRGIIALFLGMGYWEIGKLTSAYAAFMKSTESLKRANHIHFQIVSLVLLADVNMAQGRLHDAQKMYTTALNLATSDATKYDKGNEANSFIPGTINLYAGLSELNRKRGDLKTAQDYVDKGLALRNQTVFSAGTYRLAVEMALIQIGNREFANALTILDELNDHNQQGTAFTRHRLTAFRAYINLLQGKLDKALECAKHADLSAKDIITFSQEFEYLTLARVLIALYAEQKTETAIEEAYQIIENLLGLAQEESRTDSIIELLISKAIIYQVQDKTTPALNTIEEALQLAVPEGYVQVFVDSGQPVRQLLSKMLTLGGDVDYVRHLLQVMSNADTSDKSQTVVPNQLLIEPLSNRELDVLQLIINGHTNQAIADELVIALSTVKKHVNNIYGKLNVANRTQAIKRARELNIL